MYRIAEWNINCASNAQPIPEFVGDEIQRLNADIDVVLEYVKCEKTELFENKTKERGYDFRTTNNYDDANHQNDVLMAWNSEKFSLVEEYEDVRKEFRTTDTRETPNFMILKLREKSGENARDFLVAGCRITIKHEKIRRRQMQMIFKTINDVNEDGLPVILTGDFNNFRRGYKSKVWSLEALNRMAGDNGFVTYTPEGGSIYQENAFKKDYEFAEDHFIVKGCKISEYIYERSFALRHPDIYLHGKDFQVYNSKLKTNTWQIICGSGIPDHARLIGMLDLEEG